MKLTVTFASLLVACGLLLACGGGDSTPSSEPTPPENTAPQDTDAPEEPQDQSYTLPVPITVTLSYSGKNWNEYEESEIQNVGSDVVPNEDVWLACPSTWEGWGTCDKYRVRGDGTHRGIYWANFDIDRSFVDSTETRADTDFPPYIEYRDYDIQYSIKEIPSTLESGQASKRIETYTMWEGPMEYLSWQVTMEDQLEAFPDYYDIQIVTRIIITASRPTYDEDGFFDLEEELVIDKVFEGEFENVMEELDPSFWETERGTSISMRMHTQHILTLKIDR